MKKITKIILSGGLIISSLNSYQKEALSAPRSHHDHHPGHFKKPRFEKNYHHPKETESLENILKSIENNKQTFEKAGKSLQDHFLKTSVVDRWIKEAKDLLATSTNKNEKNIEKTKYRELLNLVNQLYRDANSTKSLTDIAASRLSEAYQKLEKKIEKDKTSLTESAKKFESSKEKTLDLIKKCAQKTINEAEFEETFKYIAELEQENEKIRYNDELTKQKEKNKLHYDKRLKQLERLLNDKEEISSDEKVNKQTLENALEHYKNLEKELSSIKNIKNLELQKDDEHKRYESIINNILQDQSKNKTAETTITQEIESAIENISSAIEKRMESGSQNSFENLKDKTTSFGNSNYKKSLWSEVSLSKSEQKSNKLHRSFAGKGTSFTFGFDAQLRDNLNIGLAFSRSSDQKTMKNNESITSNYNILTIYSQFSLTENLSLEGHLGLGLGNSINHDRKDKQKEIYRKNISLQNSKILIKYNFQNLSLLTITPKLGLDFFNADYKDSKNGKDNNINKFSVIAGIGFKKLFNISNDLLLIPEFHIEGNYKISGSTNEALIKVPDYEKYTGKFSTVVGGAVSLAKNNNIEISMSYKYIFKKDYNSHKANAKIKINF